MKSAVLLAALVFSAPAWAYDPREAYEAISDLTPACETGIYGDDASASTQERLEACQRVIEIQQELSENGYCFKNGEWAACNK